MRLEYENAAVANRATASVLLLYYHLLREGGFTNDQTVYVNADDFDPFTFLDVEVSEELAPDVDDVDQTLLREGAVIHLLCDLYDLVGDYEDNYLQYPLAERIRSARAAGHLAAIPEAEEIVDMISAGESRLDYTELAKRMAQVYERYVRGRFLALAGPNRYPIRPLISAITSSLPSTLSFFRSSSPAGERGCPRSAILPSPDPVGNFPVPLIVQISEGLFPKEAGRLAQTLNLLSRTEGR